MDTVLLTGANGFVGLNIADRLIAHNYKVHALVRPSSDTRFLDQMPVDIFRGELDDRKSVRQAMQNCRYVIHTAGNTSCYKKDLPELTKINVGATQQIVDVALEIGIERLVYTSTTSTIGARNDKSFSADETQHLTGFRSRSPYAVTKCEAEKRLQRAQNQGLQAVILNLAEVVGAFDHTLQWGRMVLAVNYNQVPFIPPGGGSFCSAKNAAQAHVNALTKGRTGEKYIIGGVNCDSSDFIQHISNKLEKAISVPAKRYLWLLMNAQVYEKMPRFFSKPIVDPYRMRVFGGHYYFDSSKAQAELDYQPASLDTILDESISWYRTNGYLQ